MHQPNNLSTLKSEELSQAWSIDREKRTNFIKPTTSESNLATAIVFSVRGSKWPQDTSWPSLRRTDVPSTLSSPVTSCFDPIITLKFLPELECNSPKHYLTQSPASNKTQILLLRSKRLPTARENRSTLTSEFRSVCLSRAFVLPLWSSKKRTQIHFFECNYILPVVVVINAQRNNMKMFSERWCSKTILAL